MLGRMAARVLVVKDDDGIAAPLVRTRDREGYAVHRAVRDGVQRAAAHSLRPVVRSLG